MTLLSEPVQFSPERDAGMRPARVTLVGAGPGDPELLTVKAANALCTGLKKAGLNCNVKR